MMDAINNNLAFRLVKPLANIYSVQAQPKDMSDLDEDVCDSSYSFD